MSSPSADVDIVRGTAIYLRNIEPKHHGSPAAFAERCKAIGLSWVAIAALWQEVKNGRLSSNFINTPDQCAAYAEALEALGIQSYVWGYPWQGAEAAFIAGMTRAASRKRILLDPELGANPSQKSDARSMALANDHATRITDGLYEAGAEIVGLSTYGVVPTWFPLRAFLKAGIRFAGGQTYTNDMTVDKSIASFLSEFSLVGVHPQLVPNYGLYSRNPDGTARPKTPDELAAHLMEFINEGEPVHAMIGWAENFLTPKLEPVLARFSATMARGATRLP